MEQSVDKYQIGIVQFGYVVLIFLSGLLEYYSIFVYSNKWVFFSHHTVYISGFLASFTGLYFLHRNYKISAIILIGIVLFGTIANIRLTYFTDDLAAIVSSTFGLSIVIVFASFVLDKRWLFLVSIITIILFVFVTNMKPLPPSSELHNPVHYGGISMLILASTAVQYLVHLKHENRDKSLEIEKRLNAELAEKKVALEVANVELIRLVTELGEANNELLHVNAEREKFNRMIRHEILPEVRSARFIVDKMKKSNGANSEQLLDVSEIVEHIGNLLGDSKMFVSGDGESNSNIIKLNSLLKLFADTFHSNKDIQLVTNDLNSKKFITHISKTDLMQVCQNLLSNAEKFTDVGQITLGIDTVGDCLVINVSDTGKGISPEEQKQIFDLYYTSDGSNGGEGIGLHLVYNIVKKYSGEINVSSQESVGTTFKITIPIPSKTALFFDDQLKNRKAMELAFDTLTGWNLHTFSDATNWKNEIDSHQPDLVFLDIDMPGPSGQEVVNEAKPLYNNIIFIAHTGNSSDEQIEALRQETAFDGFLPKPTLSDFVLNCLSRIGTNETLWFS
ncbi:MAG: ATP-binding protein [Bacteroidota bacterium]